MDKDYSYLNSTYAREKLIEEYNTKYIPMEDSMKLSELYYIQLLDEARQSLITKDENATNYLKEIEYRISAGEEAVKKVEELENKLTSIVRWLEKNQSDVFSRGLWDAMG